MLWVIIGIFITAADQLTKYLTVKYIAGGNEISVIHGFLKLSYVENRGAAWGLFAGQRLAFIVFTAIIFAAFIYYTIKNKPQKKLYYISVSFILGGATGNLIDRAFKGFVVDMIDITEWFDYPVFNVADCFIVAGTILLAIYILISDSKE